MSKFNTELSLKDIEKLVDLRRLYQKSDIDPFTNKSTKFVNPYKNQSLSNLNTQPSKESSNQIQEQQPQPGNSVGGPPKVKVKIIHYPELMTDNEIDTIFRTMLRKDSGALAAQKEFVKFNGREDLGITNTEALEQWKKIRVDNDLTYSFFKSESNYSLHVLHRGQTISGGSFQSPNEMIEISLSDLKKVFLEKANIIEVNQNCKKTINKTGSRIRM